MLIYVSVPYDHRKTFDTQQSKVFSPPTTSPLYPGVDVNFNVAPRRGILVQRLKKLIVERTSAVSQFEQRQRGGSMWSWIWKQPQQIVGTASGVVGIRYALHTWNIATLHICNTAIKHYTLHHTLNSTLPQEHRTRYTETCVIYNVLPRINTCYVWAEQ